jgi:hypothetical protein
MYHTKSNNMNQESNIIFHTTPSGQVIVQVQYEDGNFWLTQKRMAALFDVESHTITYHLKEIYQKGFVLDDVGATLAVAQNVNAVAQNRAGASPAPTMETIGNIVGAYKSLVANQCLDIYKLKNKYMGKLWQRNYWEHIIRNEQSLQHIVYYIINNPANWKNDNFFVE